MQPRQWVFGIHPDHPITWRYSLELLEADERVALEPDEHGVLTPVMASAS